MCVLGGTIALNDVYKTLLRLGYSQIDWTSNITDFNSVLLCDDNSYNSTICSAGHKSGIRSI